MNDQAVKEYLLAIVDRYRTSSKRKKSEMLEHAVLATKRDRKVLIRRLNGPLEDLTRKKGSGRPLGYSKSELLVHIEYLWCQMEGARWSAFLRLE